MHSVTFPRRQLLQRICAPAVKAAAITTLSSWFLRAPVGLGQK